MLNNRKINQVPQRYDFLDNLKWVLTILVILHHAAAIAGLDPIGFNLPKVILSAQWQYKVLGAFQENNQSFFMGIFFFVSAFFVVSSYQRKGAILFVSDKFKRLGIPTLIWLFVILPLLSFAVSSNYAVDNIIGLLRTAQIDLGVTWFCWTLIIFNLVWLLLTKLKREKIMVDKPQPIPAIWKILLFGIIMIPLNLLGIYLQHKLGENFLGFHLLGYFPMYIAMFFLGIYSYQFNWINQIEFKHAFAGIVLWVLVRAYLTPTLSGYDFDAYVALRGFTVIGMTLFLIYAFKILFNHKSKWTMVLSRTAFAAYVFQIPFLFIMAKIYQPFMSQVPLFNFLVIGLPSVILSFGFGYLICKTPLLKRVF